MIFEIPDKDPQRLRRAILKGADELATHVAPWGNPRAILGAFAEVESSYGEFGVPRPEKAYMWGGRYFSSDQRRRYLRWGGLACMSYSSFQIMYPTACELGFDELRCPLELWDDEIAIEYVVSFLKRRAIDRGARSIKDLADTFNSGSHRDGNVPEEYIQKFIKSYETVVTRRELWPETEL